MPEGYAARTFKTTWVWRAYVGGMSIIPQIVVQGPTHLPIPLRCASAFYRDVPPDEVVAAAAMAFAGPTS
jgi:hypothetical protein